MQPRTPIRRHHPAILTLLLLAGSAVGCGPTSFLVTPVPARHKLVENIVQRDSIWAYQKIALIDVDGLITNERPQPMLGPTGVNPVATFTEKLNHAADDNHVRAVVIRINSPGGGVTASDLMYTELLRFRQRTNKPVVAAMMDVAASGGYYLACAADQIYAQPTTVTGSIGVIMLAPEFSGTMHKLGIEVNTIKSGRMKDMGSLFRDMNDEERTLFQHLIDQMYARFCMVVERARPNLSAERVRELADGRVYLAPDAHKQGLIDEIGTLRDAVHAAKQLADIPDEPVKVVQYSPPYRHRPNIYAQYDHAPAQVNLVNVNMPAWLTNPAPQFLYLWAPSW